MFWMIPLATAAIGAMANKKNPVKGALMGGALGLTGGAAAGAMGAGAAGGLLGGAGAAGATGGLLGGAGAAGGGLAAGAGTGMSLASAGGGLGLQAGMGSGLGLASASAAPGLTAAAGTGTSLASSVATPGLLGSLKGYAAQAKPFADAAGAAGQVSGMFGQEQPIQPSPMMQQAVGGNQILAQLAQQGMQEQQMTAQAGAERRKRRQGLLGANYG